MAYYVRMTDPRGFRRDLLESSKKVIGCLQANRNVLEIRARKRELLESLQGQVKELSLLVAKLDEVLPDKELREEAIQEAHARVQEKPQAPSVPAPDKDALPSVSASPAGEEEALSRALSSIENKLRELS